MQIANPIYDVVFKYLMGVNKIAKIMISSIIGQEIEELEFRPQECVSEVEKKREKSQKNRKLKGSLTVYHLDFSAKIKTDHGEQIVIIEIQKAKYPKDIIRFRSYLGEQYLNKENIQKVKQGKRIRKSGIPIISIYFIGHHLDNTKAGVIKIGRTYTDLITGEEIKNKEVFIESLTHDSYVIQIPELTQKRRNELEILLSIFDQSNKEKDFHILNVKEENFPEKYRPIIRRLQKAISNPDIKKKMELEDGILDELEDMDREIEELTEENIQVKQENIQVKQKYERVEQEKERVEQEKERVEQEKNNGGERSPEISGLRSFYLHYKNSNS
ncbi:MAG: hypothetical protein HY738_14400 [Bacteroidia bacterium]|nr:hypothetical protein [Bacteroidia bacterium]